MTRPDSQSHEMNAVLREKGAQVIEIPLIAIRPPSDGGQALRQAIDNISTYDWLVFTSQNGVESFLEAGPSRTALGTAKFAVVGAATARLLRDNGMCVDLIPQTFTAEALVEVFPRAVRGIRGRGRVFLPQASGARDTVSVGLVAKGWKVDAVEAYCLYDVAPTAEQAELAANADIVTLFSPSAVRVYAHASSLEKGPRVAACIGPVTTASARSIGLSVVAEACEYTSGGLVDALCQWWPPPRWP